MSKEIFTREIPETVERAGNIKDLFLDPNEPVYRQKEKLQDALKAVWDISSFFYPNDRLGKTDLIPIPIDRLIELGLVSTKTVHKIETGKLYLQHEKGVQVSTVSLERSKREKGDFEFLISGEYVVIIGIHQTLKGEKLIQYSIAKEQTHLENEGGRLKPKMTRLPTASRIMVFDKTWHQISEEHGHPVSVETKPIQVTPRRINTVLTMIIEGTVPGHI